MRQERTARLATGAAGQTPPGARPNRGGRRHGTKTHFVPWPRRRSRLVARVGRVRRAARRVPEEWSSRVARKTSHEAIRTARTEPGLQAVWRYISTGRSIVIHDGAPDLSTAKLAHSQAVTPKHPLGESDWPQWIPIFSSALDADCVRSWSMSQRWDGTVFRRMCIN